jgi:hypothetical protein
MPTLSEVEGSINDAASLAGHARLYIARRASKAELSERSFANWLLESQNLRPIPLHTWRQTSIDQARELACTLLAQDLAYSAPLLSARKAQWAASQLCATLNPHASVFFASGTVEPGFKKWEPLGAATFEIALVGMDTLNAFLLLATAED